MFRIFDLKSKKEMGLSSPCVEIFINNNNEVLLYNINSATCQKLNPRDFIAVHSSEFCEKNLYCKFKCYQTNKLIEVYSTNNIHVMKTYYFETDKTVYELLDSPSDFLKYII